MKTNTQANKEKNHPNCVSWIIIKIPQLRSLQNVCNEKKRIRAFIISTINILIRGNFQYKYDLEDYTGSK
jgi:hypothetical protein